MCLQFFRDNSCLSYNIKNLKNFSIKEKIS